MANSSEFDEDVDIMFTVWRDGDASARSVHRAITAKQAAEQRARVDNEANLDDDAAPPLDWPLTYLAQDHVSGQIWRVTVDAVMRPVFISLHASEIPMQPATHVVWGEKVLCEDLRLSQPDREAIRAGKADADKRKLLPSDQFPSGQRFVSLADVRDGAVVEDPCEACWANASERVAAILKMIEKKK